MAQARKGFKRYLPVMLLAAVMAESAHAPLLDGAMGSTRNGGSGKAAPADAHSQNDPNKKAAYTWTAPPAGEGSDPSAIKKKLKELEREKPFDPWESYPLNPTGLMPDPTVSVPVDLVPSLGTPGGGGNGDAGGFYPGDSLPPITVYHGSEEDGLDIPVNPVGPTYHPHNPVVHAEATTPTAVPEPAMLSVLLGGLTLLLRPGKSRFTTTRRDRSPD